MSDLRAFLCLVLAHTRFSLFLSCLHKEHIPKTETGTLSESTKKDSTNSFPTTPTPTASPLLSPQHRHSEWKYRPGYSSGASSLGSFSDDDDDNHDKDDVDLDGHEAARALMDGLVVPGGAAAAAAAAELLSTRAAALDLDSLRKQIAAQGDICQAVVRIEAQFGKPIEEVYEGVHDGPVLGSGVSGIVRLVTHQATGVKYAVKCLDIGLIDSMEGLRQLRTEISIMCQLDHPNIVRIEEVYESTNEIYILQELCKGGDLFDRLDEQPDYHYTEAQCARLVKQMLSSVRYLVCVVVLAVAAAVAARRLEFCSDTSCRVCP